jgi:2-keto-4-pentenoate hydratase/2-oxohepta-3-ene-1,7-dioic acid hydratase in catechol pathway
MSGAWYAIGTFAAADGAPFAGLVRDRRVVPLARHLGETTTVASLLEEWPESRLELQRLAELLPAADGVELDALRPLPPVQPAAQIFQAGANYRQHLVELMSAGRDRLHHELTDDERSAALASLDVRARDGIPYVFVGVSHALCGADDDILLPAAVEKPDWELELAAVIGRRARSVSRADALEVVAGYTICNDITARDHVFRPDIPSIGTDWLAGKNWPTFLPIGPFVVPAEHAGDPMDLRITLRLNGDVMQDSSTADMMFDLPRLIEHVSAITELWPGDVLLTGSPAGNGVHHGRFLRPGDVIESEITGLGRQRNRCVAEAPQEVERLAATHQ